MPKSRYQGKVSAFDQLGPLELCRSRSLLQIKNDTASFETCRQPFPSDESLCWGHAV